MYDSIYIKFKNRSNSSVVTEFRIVVTYRGERNMGITDRERTEETFWSCGNIFDLDQATLKYTKFHEAVDPRF